jgi:hypothetical protein
MDAVEFLKALERRRNYKRGPNDGHCNWAFIYFDHRGHEELVAEVEQWAKEHPAKTRQSEFLEQWPNCMMDDDGAVGMCPRNVDKNYICDLNSSAGCPGCRREFWMQEVG